MSSGPFDVITWVVIGLLATLTFIWPFLTLFVIYHDSVYEWCNWIKTRDMCFLVLTLSFSYSYWFLQDPSSFKFACTIGLLTFGVYVGLVTCLCTCVGLVDCCFPTRATDQQDLVQEDLLQEDQQDQDLAKEDQEERTEEEV